MARELVPNHADINGQAEKEHQPDQQVEADQQGEVQFGIAGGNGQGVSGAGRYQDQDQGVEKRFSRPSSTGFFATSSRLTCGSAPTCGSQSEGGRKAQRGHLPASR